MTYNLDIINLFINYYINSNNLITIFKNLNISIPTLVVSLYCLKIAFCRVKFLIFLFNDYFYIK
jgi:hypothetical protein